MTIAIRRHSTRRLRRRQDEPRQRAAYVPILDQAAERYVVTSDATQGIVVVDPDYAGALRCVTWLTCARKARPPFACQAYSIARRGSGANGAYLRLAWLKVEQ